MGLNIVYEEGNDMSDLILSIDLGTTALKAALFDFEGKLVANSTVEYSLLTPKTNWVEADPEVYFDSMKTALAEMKQTADLMAIKAIGFSAQGETLFFVDENCKPLRNAIVWMDNRAVDEAEELRKKFGDKKCYEVTGQVSFEPCWPASKVLWVKNNEPEVFEKTKKILLIEDYVITRMTGKYVAEGSLLTSTEYWDITTKKYWPEMLEALGITEDYLPEIRESGEAVGKILPEVARELGINEEAIVCTGCLDQVAGAIGVGNIKPGIFSENIGAALAVCVLTEKLTYDPSQNMPVHYFAIPDSYMLHTFTTGGMTLRWFRDAFCKNEMIMSELTNESSYDYLSKQAALVEPGCEGLLMLPHLSGSMAPDMNANAKGVFYGITLKHKKPHFIRAIMEALAYIIRRNIDVIEEMGIKVNEIRSLGGGSKSDVWNSIIADVNQKRVVVMSSKEAACLGAAILAGKAIGVFGSIEEACDRMLDIKKVYEPNPANAEIYDKMYSNYKKLFKDLEEMFDVL